MLELSNLPRSTFYYYLNHFPEERYTTEKKEIADIFTAHKGRYGYRRISLVLQNKGYTINHKTVLKLMKSLRLRGKQSKNNSSLKSRYRLMWMDVPYEPGELKVVAYDASGKPAEEKVIRTAGKPHHLELVADRTRLSADGKDLAYITVRVVDKDGNLCPADSRMVNFSVKGAGKYRAAANGDATSLDLFHLPKMPAFSGQLTAIVQSGEQAGEIVFEARAKGLKSGKLVLYTSEK